MRSTNRQRHATQVSEPESVERDFHWTSICHEDSSDSSDEEFPVTGVAPRMGAFEFATSGNQLGFRELNMLDLVELSRLVDAQPNMEPVGGGKLPPAEPTDVEKRQHAFRRRQFMASKSSKS